ncbi:zinc-dependent alcohol dehydrogenase family protein [Thiorhodococcus mannitoliphagus]|uniref:Zinc-dependent alcohol dehydrogenase family protein n=1 Tax=Thiorhodococcus mannitoliphagus TaxID=329406 RepID=A0A6P1DVZ9_9GAMM|nr:zinc-dependent alcohol dehydrogenase family protein [Thiorhodococcus mannitoliphagus]NEX21343.1 zinc-dependent alcohol dehydrogenase family protein [Thiorhodococcus mannitoliphagus]
MKAIEIRETGGLDVLDYVDRQQPELQGPDDILVKLCAAGVNPVDTKVRNNGPMLPAGLPAVLGCDGAGVVEAVGAEVTRFKPGDEVWFCYGGIGGPVGNYAEYIVINNHLAQAKPRSIGMTEAAAAPLVLLTAWEALHDRARLHEGQRVLVHAGAGGVGHVAIQLAKAAGARVCTTVSSAEKAEFAHALGAEYCINYKEEDLVESVMEWTGGEGVDIAFDTVGPDVFRQSIPAMAHYGDLVTILEPGPSLDLKEARLRNLRISLELMLTPMLRDLPRARVHQGEILRRCSHLIDRGDLRIHVSRTFPLAQAADAHQLIEQGHVTGKLALTMD